MASLGGPGMIRKENNLLKSAFLQRSSKTLRERSMGRGKEKGAKKRGFTYRSSKVTGKDLVGR